MVFILKTKLSYQVKTLCIIKQNIKLAFKIHLFEINELFAWIHLSSFAT